MQDAKDALNGSGWYVNAKTSDGMGEAKVGVTGEHDGECIGLGGQS